MNFLLKHKFLLKQLYEIGPISRHFLIEQTSRDFYFILRIVHYIVVDSTVTLVHPSLRFPFVKEVLTGQSRQAGRCGKAAVIS